MPQFGNCPAVQRVDSTDAVNLVPKELDAHTVGVRINRPDFNRIPAHPKPVALKRNIIALVLNVNQLADELVAAFSMPGRSEMTMSCSQLGHRASRCTKPTPQ